MLSGAPEVNNCGWLCNPVEPGTPFGTPWLIVFDSFRLVVVLIGGATILLAVLSAVRLRLERGQRDRMAALGLACLAAMNTEINRLGDYPSIRLAITTACVLFALRGMWSFHRKELPAQLRENAGRDAQ